MIWAFKKCLVDISANAVRQFQVRQCGKKDEAQYLEEDFRENPFQHISFLHYLKIYFVKKNTKIYVKLMDEKIGS